MSEDESRKLVGKRVKVWWGGDNEWYNGKIVSYLTAKQRHRIHYDDGEKKEHNLSDPREKWSILEEDMTMPDDQLRLKVGFTSSLLHPSFTPPSPLLHPSFLHPSFTPSPSPFTPYV